ncbi:IS1634 family transposase [Caballeronia sordidicola]|uniref:Mobile element protein n=1 Tax=Caballeronia sordidicola TaxID=196367 RepID=A0A226X3D8_CABSO|nr:IS1634 family transposase [Caballeronia sordidicola]OXC77962.1 Mobile element protein [Caballeronia sordidicola]
MSSPQKLSPPKARFILHSERLGPLPLVNHFIDRIGLASLLDRHVPSDARCAVPHAQALGVLLRSIIVEREPIYRQQETVHGFASGMFGIGSEQMTHLSDDRLGRALDHLFDADRAALLTEVALAVAKRFGVNFDECHNDSTTISFCGSYRGASGRKIRGRTAPMITYGHSKAHRPDMKQLLFILTMTADGNIPVAFRCTDGNTSDSRTHIDTWNTLRALAGRSDFLYVADSKLCSRENMDHIDRAGGRFVTVLPRNRLEDAEFRQWIQSNTPDWTCVWDRPNPRHRDGPRDCWYVFRAPLLSAEAWPVVWVWSPLLTLRQEARRRRNIAAAIEEFQQLRARLAGAKTRLRGAAEIDLQIKVMLEKHHVARYLKVRRAVREEHEYRQTRRGRPGPETAYRKITRRRFDIEWTTDEQAIAYDHSSDGMYPLVTNDRSLSPAQVLEAHKGQPMIEKRFEQVKTVYEIAPVFLKDEGRIEALFTLYFLALLIQALIERELRLAMKRENIDELPLYPEQRQCARPTTEQILRLFSLAQRHRLIEGAHTVQVFAVPLTELQRQLLRLLGVPEDAFRPPD